MKAFWNWFSYTAWLVGLAVLPVVLIYAFQAFFFTSSCAVAGWKCEYGIGADAALAAVGKVLDADPESEVVVKKRR